MSIPQFIIAVLSSVVVVINSEFPEERIHGIIKPHDLIAVCKDLTKSSVVVYSVIFIFLVFIVPQTGINDKLSTVIGDRAI